MPSTITTYYTFQPNTKARSSQVNQNFSNYRGDLLPINESTASASNNLHYLGAPDHYWAGVYVTQVDLLTSTTTATLVIKGDTSNTTGAFDFQIEGVSKAYIGASGMTNASLEASARTTVAFTYTANASFTIPAGITQLHVEAWAAGGGGGGGVGLTTTGGGGGSGGNGSWMLSRIFQVTAGDVLSLTVGQGGAGAAATTSAGGGGGGDGVSGSASSILRGSTTLIYVPGAAGGVGGSGTNGGSPTARALTGLFGMNAMMLIGGSGGAFQASGTVGEASPWYASGGAGGGSGASKGGGGGGGGSSYGVGGLGTDGTTTGNVPANTNAAGYGAGGGGGAGHGSGGSPDNGGSGASGGAGIIILYHTKLT